MFNIELSQYRLIKKNRLCMCVLYGGGGGVCVCVCFVLCGVCACVCARACVFSYIKTVQHRIIANNYVSSKGIKSI